jgi:hypothetical protein
MATYSAIDQEPAEADPMSSSTGSLRGRRLEQTCYRLEEHELTDAGVDAGKRIQASKARLHGYRA